MDIDPRFLNGMIAKTAILGFLTSIFFGFILDPKLGLGVFAGMAISVINLRFFMFAVEKLLKRDGSKSEFLLSVLLSSKMLILIATTWLLISVGLSAFGLIFGFSLFLPSMVWQLISGSIK